MGMKRPDKPRIRKPVTRCEWKKIVDLYSKFVKMSNLDNNLRKKPPKLFWILREVMSMVQGIHVTLGEQMFVKDFANFLINHLNLSVEEKNESNIDWREWAPTCMCVNLTTNSNPPNNPLKGSNEDSPGCVNCSKNVWKSTYSQAKPLIDSKRNKNICRELRSYGLEEAMRDVQLNKLLKETDLTIEKLQVLMCCTCISQIMLYFIECFLIRNTLLKEHIDKSISIFETRKQGICHEIVILGKDHSTELSRMLFILAMFIPILYKKMLWPCEIRCINTQMEISKIQSKLWTRLNQAEDDKIDHYSDMNGLSYTVEENISRILCITAESGLRKAVRKSSLHQYFPKTEVLSIHVESVQSENRGRYDLADLDVSVAESVLLDSLGRLIHAVLDICSVLLQSLGRLIFEVLDFCVQSSDLFICKEIRVYGNTSRHKKHKIDSDIRSKSCTKYPCQQTATDQCISTLRELCIKYRWKQTTVDQRTRTCRELLHNFFSSNENISRSQEEESEDSSRLVRDCSDSSRLVRDCSDSSRLVRDCLDSQWFCDSSSNEELSVSSTETECPVLKSNLGSDFKSSDNSKSDTLLSFSSEYKDCISSEWLSQNQVLQIYPTMVEPVPDMENHLYRISTFRLWPVNAPISALKLVDAGFFLSQDCVAVQCFSCGLKIMFPELAGYLQSSSILQVHLLLNEKCSYVLEKARKSETQGGTLASDFDRLQIKQTTVADGNICGPVGWQSDRMSIFETSEIEAPQDHYLMPYISHRGELDMRNFDPKMFEINTQSTAQESDQGVGSMYNMGNQESIQQESMAGLPVDGLGLPSDNTMISQPSSLQPSSEAYNVYDESATRLMPAVDEEHYLSGMKNPSYADVMVRLHTFISWSKPEIQDPVVLTDAGYFYLNKGDLVRCFYCDIGLAEWDTDDIPWVEHARHSPGCKYLIARQGQKFIDKVQAEWAEIYTPKTPYFENKEVRLKSFSNWPENLIQTPEELADAGFYYTGEGDVVRCFYCDGGLRHWDDDDAPWIQHARWFPFCKFVLKIKGMAYVQKVASDSKSGQNNSEEMSANSSSQKGRSMETSHRDELAYSRSYEPGETSQFAATQILIGMGYTRYAVQYIINKYIEDTGKRKFTAEDLMGQVFEMEDRHEEIPTHPPAGTNAAMIRQQHLTMIGMDKDENVHKTPEDLRKENERLREQLLCSMCSTNQRNILFSPCGHRVVCEQCSRNVKKCSKCNKKVKKKVKTFLC